MEKKNITLGLVAHVDSGKTTLTEAMLVGAGALRQAGRVDHGDAFLDTHALERSRGITIFAKEARLTLPHTELTLLDTPGHADFGAEMERTLSVLDYALLIISGTDGVQAHTETRGGCWSATGCRFLFSSIKWTGREPTGTGFWKICNRSSPLPACPQTPRRKRWRCVTRG